MSEKSKYADLPVEALIATLESFEKEKAKAATELEQTKLEKQNLEKQKVELERKIEKSFEVGGTVISTIKDIPEILEICNIEHVAEYAEFYKKNIADGKPYLFLNDVTTRVSSLARANLKEIEDAQVDENGEVLIKTINEISKDFFTPYSSSDKVDDGFPSAMRQAADKFKTLMRIMEKWQNYIVRRSNLMDAQHHAFLITQKALGKANGLVIEVEEEQENKEISELKGNYQTLLAKHLDLEEKFEKLLKDKETAQAEQAKNEVMESVAIAKSNVESVGLQPDVLPVPDVAQPEEDEERRGRGRGRR